MTLLQRAIDLAVAAHRAYEDPPGEPYILHPMRVMLRFDEPDLQTVAILHDVLERTETRLPALEKIGLPRRMLRALKLLTHDDDDTYADYVIALSKDALARPVKIADLLDNADLRHVTLRPDKAKKDKRRPVRYALSYKFLTGQLSAKQYQRLMKDAEN